jgi:hypothetical protein
LLFDGNGELENMKMSVQRSRKLCLVLILFVFATSSRALAQDQPVVKPETVGLSSERIGKTVQKDIDDKRIAGAVSLVIRHGQVAWFRAQGMSDREAGKPMRTDSIFRICSMTKPITSFAAMILYEDGKFMLDDPISDYLPEFKNPKVSMKTASGVWNRGAIVKLLLREVHRSRRERNCTAVMSATSTISSPTTTPSVTPPATMFFAKFPAGCALPSALRHGWPLRR